MNPNWHRTKDLWAGVFYLAIGGIALLIARDYPMGSGARMGSGYFPMVLSVILIAIGLLSVGRGVLAEGEQVGRIVLKPLLAIAGATALFAALLPRAGLVASLLVLILSSATASRMFRLDPKALAGMGVLITLCVLVFVKGLGVPMPLLGTWFGT